MQNFLRTALALKLKALLLVSLLMGAVSGVQAGEVTYTFTSRDWNATVNGEAANWTSNKQGAGFSNNGIQVTNNSSYTGANGTSPLEYANITKIVATYNTNKNAGAGTIVVKVGDNTATTKNWAYSTGDGRTANYKTEFNYTTPQTGKVTVTLNTTTNSIYLVSVTITYADNASKRPTITGDENPFFTSKTVTITAADGAAIYYTLDGNDPTTSSTQYTQPFEITNTTTGKAIAEAGTYLFGPFSGFRGRVFSMKKSLFLTIIFFDYTKTEITE